MKNVPQVDAIALVGADGIALNWSRIGPFSHADLTGREYYTYFRDHDDPGVLIGPLSEDLGNGRQTLFVARRLDGPNGSFLGLILAVADIKYMSDFYQAASERRGEAVTLLRRDGTMLVRYPFVPVGAASLKLPQGSPWYVRVAEGSGSYFTPGTFDVIPSLVSVHVLQDYPLVIDILMDEKLVFSKWRKEVTYVAGFCASRRTRDCRYVLVCGTTVAATGAAKR